MTTRRWAFVSLAVVLGVQVSGVPHALVRLAEAKDPSPSQTAAPKAGKGATKSGATTKHAKERTPTAGNDSRPTGGPYHDPPTGSARDSGPGSGAGL